MDEEERLHRGFAVHDAQRGELGVARDEAELKRAHDRGTVGVVGRERLAGALGAGERIGADLDGAVGGRSSGERAGPKGEATDHRSDLQLGRNPKAYFFASALRVG